ncbi:KamA family radical SAM protein [Candidatus Woesearchaeota archaeon]|nr:KamA family radical SAM protein [Candidatus Woesearchaeota archaeon]
MNTKAIIIQGEAPHPTLKQPVLLPTNQTSQNFSNPPEWKQLLKKSISSPQGIADHFGLDASSLESVCAQYPARVNPYYLGLIEGINDPLYLQSIPNPIELEDKVCTEDPLHEEPEHQSRQNVPSLVTHRYPNRLLLRVSNECAMYCRFCTRKRKVGDAKKQPKKEELQKALEYISNTKEINDVILSGGDPFILDDAPLERIISSVYDIISTREDGIIRIGTRVPCVLPQRVTPELVSMLRKYHPLYVNTHFNHPAEITDESRKACNMLADAGIPIGCQTVLLKGVNDNPETMKKLMSGLGSMRVKPYYIYQADPVKGTNHFRTRVEKAVEIYNSLCGYIGGMEVPDFIIDAPGGGGKVRIPAGIVSMDDKEVVVRNYEGKEFIYPQVREEN